MLTKMMISRMLSGIMNDANTAIMAEEMTEMNYGIIVVQWFM